MSLIKFKTPLSTKKLDLKNQLVKWLGVFAAGALAYFFLKQTRLTPQAASLSSVFFATIIGLILQPVRGEQVVFISVVLVALLKLVPIDKALSGYADPVVWLVLCACLLSKGMIKTGLGQRLSYLLIRALGKRTLSLGYSIVLSDFALGSVIPSNGARSGGILFPIVKSLAESYDSHPGKTANRLGSFLMTLAYQGDVLVCATFLTGQISNFLIIKFIAQISGLKIGYGEWLLASIVPCLVSLVAVPLIIYKMCSPEIKATPKAPELANRMLENLGPMKVQEKITLFVFGVMSLLWMTTEWHQISFTIVGLLGIVALLFTEVLTWDDLMTEKVAWSVFIWYGGLMMLAGRLQEAGATQVLAESAAAMMAGQPWWIAFGFLMTVYFFAHYGFASVTAHVTAMFLPFLAVLLNSDAPKWVVVLLMAFFSNLCAALTHYGTTPGPIYFGAGYVSQAKWWKVGFVVSCVHLVIWTTVGTLWWKILGWW